jgi:hypothetical protein
LSRPCHADIRNADRMCNAVTHQNLDGAPEIRLN